MRVKLLYFDGCPSYRTAAMTLEQVFVEEGIDASIEMIRVVDEDDAVSKQFVGSPTLRVNGMDLFPDQMSGVYAMQCRVYPTPEGFRSAPSKEMLRGALQSYLLRP